MGDAASFDWSGVTVFDTFAEAFTMVGTRLVITAANERWAQIAGREACGYGTSVIACDAEAGIDRQLPADETPDGRPGVAVLMFAFNKDALQAAVTNRVGQCVLTCPTTACYDGLPDVPAEDHIPLGRRIRFFGDGYQISKVFAGRRFWRIPVMEGEFVCEDRVGTVKGVAGGNLLIGADTAEHALSAAESAVEAIRAVPDVVLPFPGGIVRSGSKVGSRYAKLKASTNDAYCPTLRAIVPSALSPETNAVYEIVIDGLNLESVRDGMRAGLTAAARSPGVTMISAGNYGGKLGKHHIHLRELVAAD